MWQEFFKDYFNFTRKERSGIIILVFIILVLIVAPVFFPSFTREQAIDHSEFENEISRLQTDTSGKRYYSKKTGDNGDDEYPAAGMKAERVNAEFFFFDPNTASVKDWIRLGIKEKTALTIQKYISKGGKFKDPADIKKIWGLHPADVERLLPYVSISHQAKVDWPVEKKESFANTHPSSAKSIHPIDINVADTTAYISLPGIGSKLSQRIIAFREKLGGFYSVDQVSETYFLPDSTFQKIKPYLIINNKAVKQININSASVDEMKLHPYIRYNLANAIFQYRKQHGSFNSIEGIKKIMIVTEEMYDKAAPYLTIE